MPGRSVPAQFTGPRYTHHHHVDSSSRLCPPYSFPLSWGRAGGEGGGGGGVHVCRGINNDMSIKTRRSTRISRFRAGPPGGAAPGALLAQGRGVQRRSERSARTYEFLRFYHCSFPCKHIYTTTPSLTPALSQEMGNEYEGRGGRRSRHGGGGGGGGGGVYSWGPHS
eukprot:6379684-Pyramimonas_sp.AAC.1